MKIILGRLLASVVVAWTMLGCGSPTSDVEALASNAQPLVTPLVAIPSHPSCPTITLNNDVQEYFISPTGSDAAPGTTTAQPLRTLAKVHEKIPMPLTKNYHVWIRGGTFYNQNVVWTKTSADFRIRIEAYPGEKPTFDGRADASTAKTVNPEFFQLKVGSSSNVQTTNVFIRGLTVRNYGQNGFVIGDSLDSGNGDDTWQQCTTLMDNVIMNIGNIVTRTDCVTGPSGTKVFNRPACLAGGQPDGRGCTCNAFAGISVPHSSFNTFVNNQLLEVKNADASVADDDGDVGFGAVGREHAFYVAYGSSNNRFWNNYVRNNPGTPFKFRHGASNNEAINNYAEQAGRGYFFLDQPNGGETKGIGNHVADNVVTFAFDKSDSRLSHCSDGCVCGNDCDTEDGEACTVDGCESGQFSFGPGQLEENLFQGIWSSNEVVTAVTAADVNDDGLEEVFAALYYPDLNFTKIVYSQGGSSELSEVAYSSGQWKVTHLSSLVLPGNDHVIAAFYRDFNTHTQIQRGGLVDGKYKIGATKLLDSSGSSAWKVTAMATGQVDGTSASKLFVAISTGGVQQIHRGDGSSAQSGSSRLGVSDGTPLYSSSNWEIRAMTTGKIDGGSSVRLVTAFHWIGSGSAKNRIYLGTGGGSGGVTDLGYFFDSGTQAIVALAAGKYDGTVERLITSFDLGGTRKVYLSGSGTPIATGAPAINAQAATLYSSSVWTVPALARAETTGTSSDGDEVIGSFDLASATELWSGNGTTVNGGVTNGVKYYTTP